ncbi:aromatic-L-amino-acid decarboxylase-like isoform X2 [Zootermopsis nevadensis]|nr:aromatic-L-amino-acid decarboxylase-like isoform X2 [Zootermopsis nevadensis]XP_021929373.1 aromatic-L-amino-acid decarboxylase-like isoform X2 [Zootermopsis nevadensis]
MDVTEFRKFARAAVDFVADYIENIRDRPVLPSVEPGYLQKLIPGDAPEQPEKWQDILADMERVIMPGITHWQSPHFHAYFPAANSYPAIVGEILNTGIACLGFNWAASPACTELEVIMMDWLAKLLDLPKEFLACTGGSGGGVIQGSASETTLVTLLAARECRVRKLMEVHPDWDAGTIRAKLVAYSSDQSNSSVEKAGVLGAVTMRLLPSDHKCRLRGATLERAIRSDREKGLIPFYVVATLGTTGTCAIDCLDELGPICKKENLWMHVDAAYAGSAFVCPEYRHMMNGLQFADSFCFNPHKWLLVTFECSAMWVKDSRLLVEAFDVDRIYLRHKNQGLSPDYRHWQIPLARRFRALKLWMVLRSYGVQGLQIYIRHQVTLARDFEALVREDDRFDVVTEAVLGLVCFRLKGPNQLTKRLHDRLMARKNIYVIAATFQDKYIIRFVVCSRVTESRDIAFAWEEIRSQANEVIGDNVDTEIDNLPHKKQNGVCEDERGISDGNGASDDISEILPASKKRRYNHEDRPINKEMAKETLLPDGINGVTLIQAEAVVLGNACIEEMSKEMIALTNDAVQAVNIGDGNDSDSSR